LLKSPMTKKMAHRKPNSPAQTRTTEATGKPWQSRPKPSCLADQPSWLLLEHQGQCVHTESTQFEAGKGHVSTCVVFVIAICHRVKVALITLCGTDVEYGKVIFPTKAIRLLEIRSTSVRFPIRP
jgi:hypothetical protein